MGSAREPPLHRPEARVRDTMGCMSLYILAKHNISPLYIRITLCIRMVFKYNKSSAEEVAVSSPRASSSVACFSLSSASVHLALQLLWRLCIKKGVQIDFQISAGECRF